MACPFIVARVPASSQASPSSIVLTRLCNAYKIFSLELKECAFNGFSLLENFRTVVACPFSMEYLPIVNLSLFDQ